MDDSCDRSVDAIGLSEATLGDLRRAGVRYVGELAQRNDFELLNATSKAGFVEIKEALAELELYSGVMLDWVAPDAPGRAAWEKALVERPGLELVDDPLPPFPPLHPAGVDRLVRGEVAAWEPLLLNLEQQPPLPAPEVVARFLERDQSFGAWAERAAAAACSSDRWTTSRRPTRAFIIWLCNGVVAALGETHPTALAARFYRELYVPEGLATARLIAADVRQERPQQPALHDALLLCYRRAVEEGAFDEALAAASEATALTGPAGDAGRLRAARRRQGASLLGLERFDEAFAILDEAMTEREGLANGAIRLLSSSGPGLASRINAAVEVAGWASTSTAEWVHALGGMADAASGDTGARLWERFERALEGLADTPNAASDLVVLIERAEDDELARVAAAARALAARRGIELQSSRHSLLSVFAWIEAVAPGAASLELRFADGTVFDRFPVEAAGVGGLRIDVFEAAGLVVERDLIVAE